MTDDTPASAAASEARDLDAGRAAGGVVVSGPPSTARERALAAVPGALPEHWQVTTLAYRRGRAIDDWLVTLAGAVESWLARRPGSAALRKAGEALAQATTASETRLRALAGLEAVRTLRGQPDVALALVVEATDPFDEEAADFLATVSDAPGEGVAILPVVVTSTAAGWLLDRHRTVVTTCTLVTVPAPPGELGPLVARLSNDARRYLRAVVDAPATHEDLRRRLGDTGAFGGGASKLAADRDEVVALGLVDLDPSGRLVPISPDLGELLD